MAAAEALKAAAAVGAAHLRVRPVESRAEVGKAVEKDLVVAQMVGERAVEEMAAEETEMVGTAAAVGWVMVVQQAVDLTVMAIPAAAKAAVDAVVAEFEAASMEQVMAGASSARGETEEVVAVAAAEVAQ